MPRRANRLWGGACALSLLVGLGACSSSGKTASGTGTSAGGSTSPSTSSPGASQAATGAPIKVGLVCDCSGTVGFIFLPEAEVYKAWVNTVNAAGGINGHPIQVITEDDGGIPGNSIADAQKLISDSVDAIVDGTILSSAWASAVQAANIPVVGMDTSDDAFFQNPDFYDQSQTGDSAVAAVISTTKAAGATNLAMFYCAEAPSCQELVSPTRTDADKEGLPVVQSSSISLSAPNYTAQCVAAQQAHVTALVVFDTSAPIARATAPTANSRAITRST